MHCLLCHEKIPRLRAWTGKSEFCCDEHSELYKKQTMERLLVDESDSEVTATALPIASDAAPAAPAVDHVLLGVNPAASRSLEEEPDSGEIDQLWKIADALGGADDSSEPPALESVTATNHTEVDPAEEALAALLSLAEESAAASSKPTPRPEPEPQVSAAPTIEEIPEPQMDAFEESVLVDALTPPDLDVAFADEQPLDLAPPEPELAQDVAEDLTPPELENWATPAPKVEATPKPPSQAQKSVPNKSTKIRAAVSMRPVFPEASLPEGGYPLQAWTDALELARPEQGALLGPLESLGMRKSSLNGTASGTFDPVVFNPVDDATPVSFPVPNPKPTDPIESELIAIAPSEAMAWPQELYVAMQTAEMKFESPSGGDAMDGAPAMQTVPAMSEEFLSRVGLNVQVFEPQGSLILTPPERDMFASQPAEEDSEESYAISGGLLESEEADGGQRNDVADLF